MNEELINKIITYNYNNFGNEFGDALVDLQQENARLKDKENKIIKKIESYNLDYLHETNEHNLADTIEYLLELLKEN